MIVVRAPVIVALVHRVHAPRPELVVVVGHRAAVTAVVLAHHVNRVHH